MSNHLRLTPDFVAPFPGRWRRGGELARFVLSRLLTTLVPWCCANDQI